jgi:hypothetical protein
MKFFKIQAAFSETELFYKYLLTIPEELFISPKAIGFGLSIRLIMSI